MEAVRGIVSLCTEGRGATKLFSNRDIRDTEQWQTMITVAGNVSLWDHIVKKVKHTDAQLQRVFEFEVEKRADSHDSTDVQRLVDSLNQNYGQMGLRYAEFLGRAPDAVDRFAKKILVDFRADVNSKSEERYRSAMAAMTIAGAALANQMGATFNIEDMYVFLKKEFLRQRDRINKSHTVGGSFANTAAVMSQFFKAYIKNTLITENMHHPGQGGRPAPLVRVSGPDPLRGDPVHIHGSRVDRIVRISRACLTDYINKAGFSWGAVEAGLRKHYNAKMDLPRINLAAGSGIAGMREQIVEIPVPPNSELEDVLFGERPGADVPPSNGVGANGANGTNGAHHEEEQEAELVEIVPKSAIEQAAADITFVKDKLN